MAASNRNDHRLFHWNSPSGSGSATPERVTGSGSKTSSKQSCVNEENNSNNNGRDGIRTSSNVSTHSKVGEPAGLDNYRNLDERFDDYSVDFERLSCAQIAGDDDSDTSISLPGSSDEEEDAEGEGEGSGGSGGEENPSPTRVKGGPEDFTINMHKYLFGNTGLIGKRRRRSAVPSMTEDPEGDAAIDEGDSDQDGQVEHQESELGQDNAPEPPQDHPGREIDGYSGFEPPHDHQGRELGEDSAFGPPVDISTPSHFTGQKGGGLSKGDTRLEPPVDTSTPSPFINQEGGPSKGGVRLEEAHEARTAGDTSRGEAHRERPSDNSAPSGASVGDLRRQILELQNAVKDRDEQPEELRQVPSPKEQIERLEVIVHQKTLELDGLRAKNHADDALQRERTRELKEQWDQKEAQQKSSSLDTSGLDALVEQISMVQAQIRDVQQQLERQHDDVHEQLQNHKRAPSDSKEDSAAATIALLRHQLELALGQSKTQDGFLAEVTAKLRDVTAAKDLELQQRQSAIDELKAQAKEQQLDIERLGAAVEQSNTGCKNAEDELRSVKDKNGKLERKSYNLEAELKESVQLSAELEKVTEAKKDMDAELTRSKQQMSQLQTTIAMFDGSNQRLVKHADELHSKLETSELEHSAALDRIEELASKLEHLSIAEKQERTLRSELSNLTAEQEAKLQSQDEENKRLSTLVAIKDEAAVVVDQRIARALEKREMEWRQREDALLRERQRMGKALLISWAEKEALEKSSQSKKPDAVAGDGRIPYRYKYAKKERRENLGNKENS